MEGSEPYEERAPFLKSGPVKTIAPSGQSEPTLMRGPVVGSESYFERAPGMSNEPMPMRAPVHQSEPSERSEPSIKRAPISKSEPITERARWDDMPWRPIQMRDIEEVWQERLAEIRREG
jgi:hypothetical protein